MWGWPILAVYTRKIARYFSSSSNKYGWWYRSCTKHNFASYLIMKTIKQHASLVSQLPSRQFAYLHHPIDDKVELLKLGALNMIKWQVVCIAPCEWPHPPSHPFCWHSTCAPARRDYLFCAVHSVKCAIGFKGLHNSPCNGIINGCAEARLTRVRYSHNLLGTV